MQCQFYGLCLLPDNCWFWTLGAWDPWLLQSDIWSGASRFRRKAFASSITIMSRKNPCIPVSVTLTKRLRFKGNKGSSSNVERWKVQLSSSETACLPCPCLKPLTVHLAKRKKVHWKENRCFLYLLFKAAPLTVAETVQTHRDQSSSHLPFTSPVSDSILKRYRKASLIVNEPPYIVPLAFKGDLE